MDKSNLPKGKCCVRTTGKMRCDGVRCPTPQVRVKLIKVASQWNTPRACATVFPQETGCQNVQQKPEFLCVCRHYLNDQQLILGDFSLQSFSTN